MIRAKNYETVSKFVKVMTKILWPLFFPDTVYTHTDHASIVTIGYTSTTYYSQITFCQPTNSTKPLTDVIYRHTNKKYCAICSTVSTVLSFFACILAVALECLEQSGRVLSSACFFDHHIVQLQQPC